MELENQVVVWDRHK